MRIISKQRRVGIYSGSFDPVHSGHIAFALKAIKISKLDKVIFMPERRPRNKPGVEHFGHRTAMIARAIKPHTKLALLELPDIYFKVNKTLPKLYKEFNDAEIIMLMGSDVVGGLKNWPDVDRLLTECELVIGLRSDHSKDQIIDSLSFAKTPTKLTIIKTNSSGISSGKIRRAINNGGRAAGLLASVRRYARSHWLYAHPPSK